MDARIDAALERVGLLAAASKRYRSSRSACGSASAIASALLPPRDLLILDEPTNGLDPQGTREVRSLLTELAAGGATVVLSTHLLSEVEQVCTPRRRDASSDVSSRRAGWPRSGPAPRHGSEVRHVPAGSRRAELSRLGLTDAARQGDTVTAAARRRRTGGHRRRRWCTPTCPSSGCGSLTADLEEMFVELTGEGFDVSG